MNQRIKQLRNTLKLSQEEFANQLKCSRSLITKIELEATTPKEWFIEDVCNKFHINKEWLVNGTGGMYAMYNNLSEQLYRDLSTSSSFKRAIILTMLKMDDKFWTDFEENFTKCISEKEQEEYD